MSYITIIGLIAATLTTAAAFPQAIKSIKTRSTADLSLAMYIMLSAGVFMWLVYGLLSKDLPLILANIFTLIPNLIILVMKIRFK